MKKEIDHRSILILNERNDGKRIFTPGFIREAELDRIEECGGLDNVDVPVKIGIIKEYKDRDVKEGLVDIFVNLEIDPDLIEAN